MTVASTPEAQLLDRYAAGERAALDELVMAHQDQGFWVARHLVGEDESARDLVQEAFVRVLRRPQLYDRARPFKAWFLQIVRNLAIDHLRRKRVRPRPSDLAEVKATAAEDHSVERREQGEQIRQVLGALPERHRELIIWRDVEGLGSDEIAVMMNADPGTTRWRVHQARKKFREIWLERYGEEP